ncbi:MAG TPA: lysophospholipid acyltransferase family protein [Phycisphaerae bacterium]|nr:lysophospholipid acyltransferase family protein [Phycisphaerae bacterium]
MLQRMWYRLLRFMSQMLYVGLMQGRAYHRDRVPTEGGLLVVANHQSYLDPILVALPISRPFSPMARESLFRQRLFSWLIRSLNAFPVKRGSADLAAIKEAIRRLRRGDIVLVFPEGTRTRDGSIGRLQSGLVLIAQRAKAPILPAVIDGAYECWPRQRVLPTWHALKVGYGEAIPADVVGRSEPDELVAELHRRMVELQAELRGEGNQAWGK